MLQLWIKIVQTYINIVNIARNIYDIDYDLQEGGLQ